MRPEDDEKQSLTKPVPAFWWDEEANYGDLLNRTILPAHGLPVRWVPAASAALVGMGSILELVPSDSRALVVGAGFMHERSATRFKRATFLAVRGKLTAAKLGLGAVALGDPGLLVHATRRGEPVKHRIGIVPHFVDASDARVCQLAERHAGEIVIVDVTVPDVQQTTDEIAACGCILSSSLHGFVTAFALGIPCAWLQLSKRVLGRGFKFRDFLSAFDSPYKSHTLDGSETPRQLEAMCSKPPLSVSSVRTGLIEAFAAARQLFLREIDECG